MSDFSSSAVSSLSLLCVDHTLPQEDSKRVSEDEHLKRKELSAKFHDTISQVTQKIDEHADEREKLLAENQMHVHPTRCPMLPSLLTFLVALYSLGFARR